MQKIKLIWRTIKAIKLSLIAVIFYSALGYSGFAGLSFGQPVILFLGDSLTEGLGVARSESYPYQTANILRQRLKLEQLQIIVDGISGSTSASGLSRLKRQLPKNPDYLFLALGANDGLRGSSNKALYRNLDSIIKTATENKITVILAGMRVPTNFGIAYSEEFSAVYQSLAKKYRQSGEFYLLEFLLADVALQSSLNQSDNLHPNAKGHRVMAENVASFLIPILKK